MNSRFSAQGRPVLTIVLACLSLCSASAQVTNPCRPSVPGIAGWWRGENNALDSAGTNHGVLKNGATFATGKIGQGFQLDGQNDYVEIADSPELSITNSITVSAW